MALGLLASAGVAATSLRALPPGLLVPLAAAWLIAFAAGALWPRGGPVLLTVLAGAVDWIPLGALNAATGIWLLRVIRHQAR